MKLIRCLTCLVLFAAMLSLGPVGCSPSVGDSCSTDSKCGTTLTCDLGSPGGYCIKTPCRSGECPPEAACIDFGAEQRYCMYVCSSNNDCRSGDGYVCRSTAICEPSAATPTSTSPCTGDLTSGSGRKFCGQSPNKT